MFITSLFDFTGCRGDAAQNDCGLPPAERRIFMPVFTPQPELITGLSDALDALASAAFLLLIIKNKSKRALPWKLLMLSLTVSGLMGFVIHTFEHTAVFERVAWVVLSLFMCVTVSLFVVCSYVEVASKRLKTVYIAASAGCVIAYTAMMIFSLFTERYLLVYTVFAAACLAFSIVILSYNMIRGKLYHLLFYIAGIIIQVPGGIIQAQGKIVLNLGIMFDYNTIYHLILLVTVILLYIGFVSGGKAEKNSQVTA